MKVSAAMLVIGLISCSSGHEREQPTVELVRIDRISPNRAVFRLANLDKKPIAFSGVNGTSPVFRQRYMSVYGWVEREPAWIEGATGLSGQSDRACYAP
jgi:hypothetical protein